MLENPAKLTQADLFKQLGDPEVPRYQPRNSPDRLQKSREFNPALDLFLLTREPEEDPGSGRRYLDRFDPHSL